MQINVDWQILKQKRLLTAKRNNDKENSSRITHDHKVGDQILIVHSRSEQTHTRKLNSPTEGPFVVTKVYKNRTVEIEREKDSLKELTSVESNHIEV